MGGPSLVPRPSPAPVFDRLQYAKTEPASGSVFAYCKRSKTGAGEGLGTRLGGPARAKIVPYSDSLFRLGI